VKTPLVVRKNMVPATLPLPMVVVVKAMVDVQSLTNVVPRVDTVVKEMNTVVPVVKLLMVSVGTKKWLIGRCRMGHRMGHRNRLCLR